MRKLIIIALIILFALGAYLLLSRLDQTKRSDAVSQTSQASTAEDKQLLEGLAERLELKPEFRDYMYMDWISENKNPLPLTGMQFIVGTVNINGIGKYNNIPQNDLTKITLKNLSPLLLTTETYFTEQGFTKSAANTRTIENPPIQTAFFGYEKDQVKCVIRIDEQTDPFGNFVCGTVDTKQEALQKEFRSLFFGQKAQTDDIVITSFRVQKVENNFALGSATGDFGGYTWIAKKTNNTWQVVYRSNDIAPCSTMQKLGIPKSIYGNCYDN